MLFVVQREDVDIFSPAEDFDPVYSKLLKEVVAAGVEIYVVGCRLSATEITPDKLLKVSFL
jgi:sugar fermentation stimulation protein A